MKRTKMCYLKTKIDFRRICFQKWEGKHSLFSEEYIVSFPLWNCLETHPKHDGGALCPSPTSVGNREERGRRWFIKYFSVISELISCFSYITSETGSRAQCFSRQKSWRKWSIVYRAYCCCLVAQLCPTLCDPRDHQAPLSMGFPRQEY